ncbi:beta-ketoacyl-[acyl-carrier-protein] synthase family protein [Serratia quinivorans]|uniref:beta-ketoacyl-[acyl-carrier-protein] synthase family protein n=1 Tax=Serratia quinivorans TaxID=137545 RepID=UPI0021789225|nr:beta-ketoacyl-[acyl-carrier-protein] synthase family protein [Serratia quinivorans]CAI0962013.1 3-oxoacyl-[acyl-carrier-protein] synthase 2 [Serratia quinivorans]CAI1095424.1 3-oxoacyl-[acyl-carrier-protein] synthase 2 [Serratia quinivorans]CAI1143767.1 3-oxoacyl-[acyl-carrier-protein] synthase 2 [Serratia quinivorans]CAI1597681.1 3-oxoacyl-[acyl-carrier-protein] synthase 2 [Serratia quinivorans]CAI2080600.1 3-oxoacyl-[acyl-carrier-protein] synthase 2 [Serratia quinivorans]
MVYFSAVGMVNALGNNLSQIAENLALGVSPGMQQQTQWLLDGEPSWFGNVQGELPVIPELLKRHNSRNNRLLLAALAQIDTPVRAAIARYGADRVAVIMGTSTSGIHEGELALQQYQTGQWPQGYDYRQQELGDPGLFLSAFLATRGPAYTLSTACSSSARAIISGKRLIDAGLVDAAIVGGADSLCQMPINGFNSLESLSAQRCTPFAAGRSGINIGEAAALMLLTREPAAVALLGVGESSDAWHMSAPHPAGEGAERAIGMALWQAGLNAGQIGYINLHGTATRLNDQVEAQVVNRLFGTETPCSSTKHLTGHTLGAAGAVEAALSWLLLTQPLPLPQQDFSRVPRDAELAPIGLVCQPQPLGQRAILSNSFAFGGNNACLLLGDAR